jgi:hypothetical protein
MMEGLELAPASQQSFVLPLYVMARQWNVVSVLDREAAARRSKNPPCTTGLDLSLTISGESDRYQPYSVLEACESWPESC